MPPRPASLLLLAFAAALLADPRPPAVRQAGEDVDAAAVRARMRAITDRINAALAKGLPP